MSLNNPNYKLPNFLIIGAAKSGTTSLYFYLKQHPQIFMPFNKEPFFFTFEGQNMDDYRFIGDMASRAQTITNIEDYRQLFEKAPEDAVIGEASTLYLYDKNTPQCIHEYIPDVKMIAILRNPVDRAFSHFRHFRREAHEPIHNFGDVINEEQKRMQEKWFPSYYYVDTGFYSQQIKNYLSIFPKEQLKVFLYEDLQNTQALMQSIFEYIGVDANVPIDTSAKFNVSGKVKFPWLYKLNKKSGGIKEVVRNIIPAKNWNWMKNQWDALVLGQDQKLSDEVRQQLIDRYRDDIVELQTLIDRDLSHWLN